MPEPLAPPCLLLTATIQVKDGMVFTSRRQTETRLADYQRAFTRWLAHPEIASIVFVENSAYDLSSFAEMAARVPAKRVEFLSFQAPEFDGSLGKGYGEMLCLEHALAHSKLLAGAGRIFKVTGRYDVRNTAQLLRFAETRPEAAVICDLLLDLTWADSRAFIATPDFLRTFFFPMKGELNDSLGSNFEHVLARAVHAAMAARKQWAQPPFPLEITGVSGSQNRDWHMSLAARTKLRLRHALFARCLRTGPK